MTIGKYSVQLPYWGKKRVGRGRSKGMKKKKSLKNTEYYYNNNNNNRRPVRNSRVSLKTATPAFVLFISRNKPSDVLIKQRRAEYT